LVSTVGDAKIDEAFTNVLPVCWATFCFVWRQEGL
jgi:hypothetical protein